MDFLRIFQFRCIIGVISAGKNEMKAKRIDCVWNSETPVILCIGRLTGRFEGFRTAATGVRLYCTRIYYQIRLWLRLLSRRIRAGSAKRRRASFGLGLGLVLGMG